jgi:hypothetical protein
MPVPLLNKFIGGLRVRAIGAPYVRTKQVPGAGTEAHDKHAN